MGVYQKIYINWIKGLFTKSRKSTINQNLFIATQPYFRRAAPARGSVPGLPTLSCSQTSTTQPQRITQWNLHQHHIPYLWVCTLNAPYEPGIGVSQKLDGLST